ncbi:hypothetical protein CC78DRAFT_532880 [Lojkania enalia]|uniref:Utp8 beta-propeller domain-containing protein n=1 Tax=Lojkania enalia TaxID=147567 RepID=A0A9P4N6I2_9PLEO|nr:hypothetical protein CC78DRAFT_532880 [Didymosphaeria enalia]
MSSEGDIGAPFTIASLPRPVGSTSCRTQAASVCSLSRSKKRKRTEIAVGVDGEGILIYSLQNPQLVTSYALPPQTSFMTAPYSLYHKGTSETPSRRFTYASVSPSTPSEHSQLVGFVEQIEKDGTADTAKYSHVLPETVDEVVAIEALPTASRDSTKGDAHDVLVICQNGHVVCLSANLDTVRWSTTLDSFVKGQSKILGKLNVDYVIVATARNVIRGLLRSREDIAAILNPSLAEDNELLDLTQVLCAVCKVSNSPRMLGLYQIQTQSANLITSNIPSLRHLATWTLPTTSRPILDTGRQAYSLHPTTGILHELRDGTLVSYDFSATMPKIYSEFQLPSSAIKTFLRISPDIIFATSQHSASIFNVKYNSVQALVPIDTKSNESSPSKKRKFEDPEPGNDQESVSALISYYAEGGLAVGISDHELVGIHLRNIASRKRHKTTGSLLIDSIGKGIPSQKPKVYKDIKSKGGIIGEPLRDSPEWRDWQKKVQKLDKYASKGKVRNFEKTFADALGIDILSEKPKKQEADTKPTKKVNGVQTTSLTNSVDEEILDANDSVEDEDNKSSLQQWKLPQIIPDSQRHLHRHKAIYALSKIFRLTSSSPTQQALRQSYLEITFFPPNVFEWLLLSGHLTKEAIHRSIFEYSAERTNIYRSISDGDIVRAIVEYDPEWRILSAVLNHTHYLPIGEVVQAVKLLVQSLDDHPKVGSIPNLITNGTKSSKSDLNTDLISELDAATNDLDHALSILDNGVLIRSETLRPALIRLQTFPTSVITSALRSMLPRRDLESLIQLLLCELRNGGWTSPYIFSRDPEPLADEPATEDIDDHAVAIIASLLSCTLDAIGTSAWLAGVGRPSSDNSAEEIMNDLHEETASAINGFWEARFMKGLLSEFLRYAANIKKTHKPTNQRLQNQGKPFGADVSPDEALPMLPLGGKVDLGIEKTKPGKGGKREERSAREIGMLISKRVPRYSFERIVI